MAVPKLQLELKTTAKEISSCGNKDFEISCPMPHAYFMTAKQTNK
jgi:hypothetical protein